MTASLPPSTTLPPDPTPLARALPARRSRATGAAGIALWLLVITGGLLSGGALYELVVTVPLWFGDAPASVTAWDRGVIQAPFFMVVTNGWVLMSVVVFALSFAMPRPVRPWARLPGVLGVIILVWTATYFVPVLLKTQGNAGAGLSGEEITRDVTRWVSWNHVRLVLLAGAWLASIRALVVMSRREA